MSPFFVRHGAYCCRGNLVGQTTFYIYFSGLQKLSNGLRSVLSFGGGGAGGWGGGVVE
jgi:hypothetical protein